MPHLPRIEIVEFEKKDLSNYTLVDGFPGMGLVGTIAAKYLVEKMNFKELGYIDSNVFVPIIRIQNGLPIYPSRIYVNDENKLIVIISEQIIPKNYTEHIAKTVIDWAKAKKVKRLISLAGITADASKDKSIVYGIAANEKSKKELEKHGVRIIENGITTGITALMLLELKQSQIMAYSILGTASFQADYKAASALIAKLNDMLGLKIDVQPLLAEAKETEKLLLKQLEDLKKADNTVSKLEEQTPTIA